MTGGYTSDLLSCAMAGAAKGNLWVTLQGHLNVVAVASLNELAGVIVTEGKPVTAETAGKAEEEGVVLLQTPLSLLPGHRPAVGSGGAGETDAKTNDEGTTTFSSLGDLRAFVLLTSFMPTITADLHLHTVLSRLRRGGDDSAADRPAGAGAGA